MADETELLPQDAAGWDIVDPIRELQRQMSILQLEMLQAQGEILHLIDQISRLRRNG